VKGAEGALFVVSAFIFTMFIVMSNIMVSFIKEKNKNESIFFSIEKGGLAVADVKEFRLNAKREHLHARIETILHLQRKFGFICEICSKIVLKFFDKCSFSKYLFKYDLRRLEIQTNDQLNISISNQTGLLKATSSDKREKNNEKNSIDQMNLIIKKQNQLKQEFQDSTLRTDYQLRRIALQLRTDIIDLKQHLDQLFLNR